MTQELLRVINCMDYEEFTSLYEKITGRKNGDTYVFEKWSYKCRDLAGFLMAIDHLAFKEFLLYASKKESNFKKNCQIL